MSQVITIVGCTVGCNFFSQGSRGPYIYYFMVTIVLSVLFSDVYNRPGHPQMYDNGKWQFMTFKCMTPYPSDNLNRWNFGRGFRNGYIFGNRGALNRASRAQLVIFCNFCKPLWGSSIQ